MGACRNEVLDVPMGVLLCAVPLIRMVWHENVRTHDHALLIITFA
jgi:hypothetical protein